VESTWDYAGLPRGGGGNSTDVVEKRHDIEIVFAPGSRLERFACRGERRRFCVYCAGLLMISNPGVGDVVRPFRERVVVSMLLFFVELF